MRKKPMITTFQLLLMAVGSALIFPYTFLPILASPPANQDVWIALLMAAVYIMVLNAPLLFIMHKFKGVSAQRTVEMIMGRPLGACLSVVFILFFAFCQTACMMIEGQFIGGFILFNTPIWLILLALAAPLIYASWKGAGTIGRLAPFFVLFMFLSIIFFFLFGIEKMDIKQIQPVLADSSFVDLNLGAFYTAARYSEILIFFVYSYYLGGKASIVKTYFAGIGVFAVCFMLILLPVLLVLGVELAQHVWNPYYVFSRQIEAFGFLEKLQGLSALAWVPVAIMKLTMYNYMASHFTAELTRAKTHKYFVIPFALLAYGIGMLPIMQKTTTFEFLTSDRVFPFIILPVIFVLPVLMLIVWLFRRKKISVNLMFAKEPKEEK